MSHQCLVKIDNSNNPHSLTLVSISDPDHLDKSADGEFINVQPDYFSIVPGAVIGAHDTISFTISRDRVFTAGALLIWSTGTAENNSLAYIYMMFRNGLLKSEATLNVVPQKENGGAGKLAYGVSYFYGAQGVENPKSRDYLNKPGSDHSPAYIDFSIAYNQLVDALPESLPLNGITNVVMLMLENRGFDHLVGALYDEDPKNIYPVGSRPPMQNSSIENPINFDGLHNNPDFSNIPKEGGPAVRINPVFGTLNVPEFDPGEPWADVNQQVFNTVEPPLPGATPNMQGFLANYQTQKDVTSEMASQIMQYYTPYSLPVMNALAKNYGVSDAWHCSVPSQTSPNRAFSLCGTSCGYVDNYDVAGVHPLHSVIFESSTLFNVLSNCGKEDDWKMYYRDDLLGITLTDLLFHELHQYAGTDKVASYKTFEKDVKEGKLPAFSYLEPSWFNSEFLGLEATDYHPPYNVAPGERELAKVYDLLTTYKDWDTTLFIVTFDEHGGTFDHVAPGSTIAPDDMRDWSNFGFDRLGIRIPTLLISPMIEKSTVFRSPNPDIPFDHTSFLKTILGWRGIDITGGVLGARAAIAPDFSGVLSNTAVNTEKVILHPPHGSSEHLHSDLNDLQKFILPALAHTLTGHRRGHTDHTEMLATLRTKKTNPELSEFVRGVKKSE
jgi:phospholipase C